MRYDPIHLHDDLTCGISLADINDVGEYRPFEDTLDGVANLFGIQLDTIKHVKQVHKKKVIVLPSQENGLIEADAMITNDSRMVFGVKVADCCGILLYDPDTGARAAIHSGWRGTAMNIVEATLQRLQSEYAVKTGNLLAALSPCASQENYQVGEDVHSALSDWCVVDPRESGKWRYDNQGALHWQLVAGGIPAQNISVDERCTIAERSFHSYRRDRETSGRGFVFIGTRIAGS